MKISQSLKLIFLFSIVTFQCKKPPQKTVLEDNLIFFSLKTSECSGTCPVYEFTIAQNGAATYVGTANVDMLGTYTSGVNSKELQKLTSNLDELDFVHFKVTNNTLIKDLPTTYFYYKKGSLENNLTYYTPVNKKADKVIALIDSLINRLDWQKK